MSITKWRWRCCGGWLSPPRHLAQDSVGRVMEVPSPARHHRSRQSILKSDASDKPFKEKITMACATFNLLGSGKILSRVKMGTKYNDKLSGEKS